MREFNPSPINRNWSPDDKAILDKLPLLRDKIKQEGIGWIQNSKRDELSTQEISFLLHGFGKDDLFAKYYFDQINLPDQEKTLTENPQGLIALRKAYTQFIKNNLTLSTTGLTQEQKTNLSQEKEDFLDNLKKIDEEYAEWINGTKPAIKFDNLLYQAPSFDPEIQSHIYPSIRFQDSFIHWRSSQYAAYRLNGQTPKLQFRIYLNPETTHAIPIFQKIINKARTNNMLMTGKIQDRALELGDERKRKAKQGKMRGDGIVLYLPDEASVKEILSYVLEIYQENPNIFNGRSTNKIPCPIVPGISIGNEPDATNESLTSHRVKFLQHVTEKVKQTIGVQKIDEATYFKNALNEEAPKYNINPDNIAFNLKA